MKKGKGQIQGRESFEKRPIINPYILPFFSYWGIITIFLLIIILLKRKIIYISKYYSIYDMELYNVFFKMNIYT